MTTSFSPLKFACIILLKSIGLILMRYSLGERPTRSRSGWRRHSRILFWGQWVRIWALHKQWFV